MQDIEDRVFAGNDRSVTKSKAEQSIILPSFITIYWLIKGSRIGNTKNVWYFI
jgi:hypothetical protein